MIDNYELKLDTLIMKEEGVEKIKDLESKGEYYYNILTIIKKFDEYLPLINNIRIKMEEIVDECNNIKKDPLGSLGNPPIDEIISKANEKITKMYSYLNEYAEIGDGTLDEICAGIYLKSLYTRVINKEEYKGAPIIDALADYVNNYNKIDSMNKILAPLLYECISILNDFDTSVRRV